MRQGQVVLLALFLAGCGAVRPAAGVPPAPVVATAEAALGPDRARVYTNGAAATQALVDAVNGATVSVDAEIYEFGRADLLAAMLSARRRGVLVRMVGDPTVAVTVASGRRLAATGVEVGFFPVEARQIDHVKLLVVDDRVAFFGGVNWGAQSFLNRDYELRLTGPVVDRLARMFAVDLQRAGKPVDVPPPGPPERADEPAVRSTFPSDAIGRAVLETLRKARSWIDVEMYVMTDATTISTLAFLARHGVAVRVLFDPGQDLNQAAMAQLLAAGARCRFYRSSGEKLHAKVAVVDGEWLIAGSANWTASGFRHNHELDAVLRSPELARAVTSRMDADWAAAA